MKGEMVSPFSGIKSLAGIRQVTMSHEDKRLPVCCLNRNAAAACFTLWVKQDLRRGCSCTTLDPPLHIVIQVCRAVCARTEHQHVCKWPL